MKGRGMRHGGGETSHSKDIKEKVHNVKEKEKLLHVVNELQKYVVSASVAGTIALRRADAVSCCVCLGALVNAGIAKMLKRALKTPRPNDSTSDDGMPSSHAASLFFLATGFGSGAGNVVSVSLCICACALSWLRIRCGLHTLPQVLCGAALGVTNALLWLRMLPYVTSNALVLRVLTLAGAVFFCCTVLLKKTSARIRMNHAPL